MKLQLFRPIRNTFITQIFGVNGEWYRKNGINILGHNGIDYSAWHGQPVRAAHDGKVYYSYDGKEGFGAVVMTHDKREYLPVGECYWKSIYWHFCDPKKEPQFEPQFQSGDPVRCGDVIGYADSTGFSTGDHLHFALKPMLIENEQPWAWYNLEQENGYMGAVSPEPYLSSLSAEEYADVRDKVGIITTMVRALADAIQRFRKAA